MRKALAGKGIIVSSMCWYFYISLFLFLRFEVCVMFSFLSLFITYFLVLILQYIEQFAKDYVNCFFQISIKHNNTHKNRQIQILKIYNIIIIVVVVSNTHTQNIFHITFSNNERREIRIVCSSVWLKRVRMRTSGCC